MKKILLISDNHSYEGQDIIEHVKAADEVWHAGDIGDPQSIEWIKEHAELRGVYGNIDTKDVRFKYPLVQSFTCERIKVLMTHIGGYPGKYRKGIPELIAEHKPNLFICGHSHILKVMPDKENDLLHMNPGAYGHYGFHSYRTVLKFEISNGKIENLNAIELGIRGEIKK